MKKEALTKAKISKDIKTIYSWKDPVQIGIAFLVGILLLVLCCLFFCKLQPSMSDICWSITAVIAAVILFCIGFEFYYTYRMRCCADSTTYQVHLDQLIQIGDDCHELFLANGFGIHYHLVFASCGKFPLRKTTYYSRSDLYQMTDEGIVNTSVEGDTFYVVTNSKKSILMVYNTKLFEYKE